MAQRSTAQWALALAVLAVVAGGLWLGSLTWFPEIISSHGRGVQKMLDFTLIATGAFFVAGHLALAYLLLRRRRGTEKVSRRAERLTGVLPALLMAFAAEGGVLILGLPVWGQYYGPPPKDVLDVQITARQFFWVAHYAGPDGMFGRTSPGLITTESPIGLDPADPASADDWVLLNELVLPVDRAARLTLHSTDVIHSFFVPELRIKQDVVPGMAIPIWFTPTQAGDFEIACNQICGLAHYRMKAALRVLSAADYTSWQQEQTAETS